jgi:Thiamine biosynthesis ATP pyrophosphatase
MPSPEMAAFLGSAINRQIPGLRVDLDHPQYELQVEVREIGGFVCDHRCPAPGGLPFGTQGRFLSLLSSGIDSPVAAWMMMKRGCVPQFLFFDAETWAGEDVPKGARENFRRLSLWCPGHTLTMGIVPMGDLYPRMEEKDIPPRFRCVICKRFMYRVGGMHAEQVEALALVTGENLGQVASQTLSNLATISEATNVPVLRPLITWDKKEIVDYGRKIGTFPGMGGDLSCRAVPHKPSTGADLTTVKELELYLGLAPLAEKVLALRHTITARDGILLDRTPSEGSGGE